MPPLVLLHGRGEPLGIHSCGVPVAEREYLARATLGRPAPG